MCPAKNLQRNRTMSLTIKYFTPYVLSRGYDYEFINGDEDINKKGKEFVTAIFHSDYSDSITSDEINKMKDKHDFCYIFKYTLRRRYHSGYCSDAGSLKGMKYSWERSDDDSENYDSEGDTKKTNYKCVWSDEVLPTILVENIPNNFKFGEFYNMSPEKLYFGPEGSGYCGMQCGTYYVDMRILVWYNGSVSEFRKMHSDLRDRVDSQIQRIEDEKAEKKALKESEIRRVSEGKSNGRAIQCSERNCKKYFWLDNNVDARLRSKYRSSRFCKECLDNIYQKRYDHSHHRKFTCSNRNCSNEFFMTIHYDNELRSKGKMKRFCSDCRSRHSKSYRNMRR